jgi:hypothetical protein
MHKQTNLADRGDREDGAFVSVVHEFVEDLHKVEQNAHSHPFSTGRFALRLRIVASSMFHTLGRRLGRIADDCLGQSSDLVCKYTQCVTIAE